jgi:hypothetical protein
MKINSLKDLGDSYLVNGKIYISKSSNSNNLQEILEWIEAGGEVERFPAIFDRREAAKNSVETEGLRRISALASTHEKIKLLADGFTANRKEIEAIKNQSSAEITEKEATSIEQIVLLKESIAVIESKIVEIKSLIDNFGHEQIDNFNVEDDSYWL